MSTKENEASEELTTEEQAQQQVEKQEQAAKTDGENSEPSGCCGSCS